MSYELSTNCTAKLGVEGVCVVWADADLTMAILVVNSAKMRSKAKVLLVCFMDWFLLVFLIKGFLYRFLD